MKKIIFIGNGDMYRSKFAEAYFNNLGKLECLFMLNTHGMGRYPSSRYPAAYSSNIDLDESVELNEFSQQVCDSYLMYGADCYTKEHTKISDKDFAHCDKIVVISEKEQKDFMIENYTQSSLKNNLCWFRCRLKNSHVLGGCNFASTLFYKEYLFP